MNKSDIAKNLLVGKTCDNCMKKFSCESSNETCGEWVGFLRMGKITFLKPQAQYVEWHHFPGSK